jgi:hypothetical protein
MFFANELVFKGHHIPLSTPLKTLRIALHPTKGWYSPLAYAFIREREARS